MRGSLTLLWASKMIQDPMGDGCLNHVLLTRRLLLFSLTERGVFLTDAQASITDIPESEHLERGSRKLLSRFDQ